MKKNQVLRTFLLTDGVLKQKADELIALIDRDSTEFADRGYTPAKKATIVNARNAVENFPSDEQLEAIKVSLTAQKDASRAALEKAMRTVFNMAENAFGAATAKYREFGNADIARQSDAELARTAKITVSAAQKYTNELAPEGLTAGKITLLDTQREAFDLAIDDQAKGISDRDVATEARIEALNELYSLLVKYANIGKDIFYETNEAKYNDYIIYDTPSGTPPAPGLPIDPVI